MTVINEQNENLTLTSNQSDRKLWQAYHKGDLAAFGVLFRKHQNRLFLIINSWVKDSETAQDIVQEVAVKILEKGQSIAYIEMDNFLVWAVQFARNIWRSNQRNLRRRAEIVAEEIVPYTSTSCNIQAEEDVERMKACLKKVKKLAHRRILVLVYQGYKNPDIAQRMNKSTKWVKDHRCQAKKEFKRLLMQQGLQ